MRLVPRLASDMATSFSPILKKAIDCRTLLSGSRRKATGPVSPTAPLLHLGKLSSRRDRPASCLKPNPGHAQRLLRRFRLRALEQACASDCLVAHREYARAKPP